MTRVLSGIQPTGEIHLGNYLGALRHWVDDQHTCDAFYCVVDLHALTVPQDPGDRRASRRSSWRRCCSPSASTPTSCTLFVQSHVPEHTELSWLMECTASVGELQRMTQFKEKSAKQARLRLGRPAHLPGAAGRRHPPLRHRRVPVGDDQRQHLELTRDIAIRFNHRYGDTFVVPEGRASRRPAPG